MGTKTISIMDDAYELLLRNKAAMESFSTEIRRVFAKTRTRSLRDYFGILSDEEGDNILKVIEKSRAYNRASLKQKMKEFS